jgi:DNA-binding winged helix-turn-helix (wHTH) protein
MPPVRSATKAPGDHPPSATAITFGPYRLDPDGPRLWKGDHRVPLQPRPLAVLCYLAARPCAVVGREELIKTLWAGTYVTRAVLKVAVRAIRETLEDDADAPRYIETVGREGYRFIGERASGSTTRVGVPSRTRKVAMVGRERDVAALRAGFGQAIDGARQMFFVTGEAGIGKTTLIDRFV